MILIISESFDKITDNVIDWFISNNIDYIRINETDLIKSVHCEESIILEFDDFKINIDKITTVWHRRGDLRLNLLKDEKMGQLPKEVYRHLAFEWTNLKEYLFYNLYKKNGIFNKNGEVNKLITLQKAKDVGLKTLNFSVVDKKINIPVYSSITKAISDSLELSTSSLHYSFYTECFHENEFEISNSFYPTLFQESIRY